MKEMRSGALAATYVGCFLGAGYVSGQELWQFFGAFGNWGYLGFLVAAVLFVLFGILLVRLTQLCGSAEMDRVLIPWDIPWMRRLTGAIAALFLLGVVVIMTAGVAALLQQLFQVPVWLGAAVFTLIVALAAMAGVTGMVRAFSALVPVLVGAALCFAVAAYGKYGTGGIFSLTPSNTNPLMPNWFTASLTYVAYNMLGAIGIMTPVALLVRRRRSVYGGIALAGGMLFGVAFGVISALAVYPQAAQAQLPMVALAATLHPLLGVGYGVLLLLSMFCNALASLVALATYLEQKHPVLQTRRKLLPAVMAPLIWGGSLVGFGDLIGVVFPVFGYVSIILLILMVVHLIRCKRAVHSVKTEPAVAGDAVNV